MLSFVQMGWFWLLVGSLLLLLAACLLLPNREAPREASSSSHPILSFTVMPFATENLQNRYLEPSLSYIYTPITTTSQRQISPPTDDDYYTSSNCIASPNGGYSCLGRVWNNSNDDSGSILLSINLLNEQNQIISNQTILVEQWLIPSQSFAPYRAIIAPLERNYQKLETTVERIIPSDSRVHSLKVIDSRGQMNSTGRYRLTTTILNDVGETVENVRLFASLVDDEQQIVAYRIYEVEEHLANGDRQVIELEIIPQTMPDSLHHELHVEGRVLLPN